MLGCNTVKSSASKDDGFDVYIAVLCGLMNSLTIILLKIVVADIAWTKWHLLPYEYNLQLYGFH